MRDIDSEHGAEVFHKEKRKRLGVITTRWIQTRERNEALDLMVMCCAYWKCSEAPWILR